MAAITPPFKQIASGLRFPEGPVAMPDGSVILVEIERMDCDVLTKRATVPVRRRIRIGVRGYLRAARAR